MDFLSLENESVIPPRRVARVFLSEKGVTEMALGLDDVAIITFTRRDYLTLVEETGTQKARAWSGRSDGFQNHRETR
jgi:hypothetical protein